MARIEIASQAATGGIDYNEVPSRFLLCGADGCPLASSCLRRRVWDMVPTEQLKISIVNPAQVTTTDACPHYQPDTPVIYARGFKQMQTQMLPAQYKAFSSQLLAHYGHNGYFDRRRGTQLCSPQDITYIHNLLHSLGLPALEFDETEERYNWD